MLWASAFVAIRSAGGHLSPGALARTTSGKMGATTYAVPGLVVLMSWLILGQVPRWLTIAGGALCLAGVAASRSRPVRRATPASPVAVAADGRPR